MRGGLIIHMMPIPGTRNSNGIKTIRLHKLHIVLRDLRITPTGFTARCFHRVSDIPTQVYFCSELNGSAAHSGRIGWFWGSIVGGIELADLRNGHTPDLAVVGVNGQYAGPS